VFFFSKPWLYKSWDLDYFQYMHESWTLIKK
jgi:hypothetical protein